MKLQAKILIILSVAWLVVLLLVSSGFRYYLLQDALILDKRETLNEIKRADQVLVSLLRSLQGYANDWAHWDGAYYFLLNQRNDPAFIKNNVDPAFQNLHVDFMLFFDPKGKYVYGQSYDYKSNKAGSIENSLLTFLPPTSPFLTHSHTRDEHTGLLKLPEGYVLLSSAPVTRGDMQGAASGTFVIGYFLTKDRLADISKIVQAPISILSLGIAERNPEVNLAEQELQKEEPYAAVPVNAITISAFAYLRDVEGNPIGFMRVDKNRYLYINSLRVINNYIGITVCVGLAILILMWCCLKIFFLDRLLLLNKEIVDINFTNQFSKRLSSKGKDEISTITFTINTLLSIIEMTQEQLKYRLFQRNEELDRLSQFNKNLLVEIDRRKRVEVELKDQEQELRELIYQDMLTHLPNRIFFYEFLNKIIRNADRSQSTFAILFLDIDKFKLINDTYGHERGDQFLKYVAEQLKHNLREGDVAARLAGDEFIIYLHNITEIDSLVQRLIEKISRPFLFKHVEIVTSASIGISLYPADGKTLEELQRHADLAMYVVKKKGGNGYYYYHEIKYPEKTD